MRLAVDEKTFIDLLTFMDNGSLKKLFDIVIGEGNHESLDEVRNFKHLKASTHVDLKFQMRVGFVRKRAL